VVKHWVVNASPIISLTKIDRIHLLSDLCDQIVIPQGVADEINQGGYADSAVTWLQQTGKAFIQAAPEIDSKVANWDLGLGESQVLSWVISHTGYEAIIDDLAARKAAQILQIPVRGTLAVIVLAKQMGHISSVKQDLENLVEVGLRISPVVFAQALTLAEEQ
jgi:predicted nucleic acid-binding protein